MGTRKINHEATETSLPDGGLHVDARESHARLSAGFGQRRGWLMRIILREALLSRSDDEMVRSIMGTASGISMANPDIDVCVRYTPRKRGRAEEAILFRKGKEHPWSNRIHPENDTFIFEADREGEKGIDGSMFIKMDLISFTREVNFTGFMRCHRLEEEVVEAMMCDEEEIVSGEVLRKNIFLYSSLARRFFSLFVGIGNIVSMENETDEGWEQQAVELLAEENSAGAA